MSNTSNYPTCCKTHPCAAQEEGSVYKSSGLGFSVWLLGLNPSNWKVYRVDKYFGRLKHEIIDLKHSQQNPKALKTYLAQVTPRGSSPNRLLCIRPWLKDLGFWNPNPSPSPHPKSFSDRALLAGRMPRTEPWMPTNIFWCHLKEGLTAIFPGENINLNLKDRLTLNPTKQGAQKSRPL